MTTSSIVLGDEHVLEKAFSETPVAAAQNKRFWANAVSCVCLASMLISSAVALQAQTPFPTMPILISPVSTLTVDIRPSPGNGIRFPNSEPDAKRRRYVDTKPADPAAKGG